MKKLRFLSIFLVGALLTGLLSTTAVAAPEGTFEKINVDAKAALLVDADTGQVLLDQNANQKSLPRASQNV